MTPAGKRVILVAAVADNGVIGADGGIPWHIPGEQARFKTLTLGHCLVMGRATYESIGRPLPGRTNIVLTRRPGWSADGVLTAASLDEAIRLAEDHEGDVMVIGGSQVYAEALPLADEQVLTEVHRRPEGDTLYPAFDKSEWREASREEGDGWTTVRLVRRAP